MNVNPNYIAETTMVSDIEGPAIDMRGIERLGVQAVWGATAAPTGVLKLQVSYDYVVGRDEGTWKDVDSGTFATSPAGVAGETSENWRGIMAPWVRVLYDVTSGGAAASLDVAISHL